MHDFDLLTLFVFGIYLVVKIDARGQHDYRHLVGATEDVAQRQEDTHGTTSGEVTVAVVLYLTRYTFIIPVDASCEVDGATANGLNGVGVTYIVRVIDIEL